MLSKDYSAWHARKEQLNSGFSTRYFYEREVWWVAIGHNIGDEEDGKGSNFARPVLIVRKFNHSLFYGLPLSTAIKQGRYYYKLSIKGTKNIVMLSHMRDYDSKRLLNKLGVIGEAHFTAIQTELVSLLCQPSRQRRKLKLPP